MATPLKKPKLKLVVDNKKKTQRKKWQPNYPHYHFKKYDPIMDQIDEAMVRSGYEVKQISDESHVSRSTLNSWAKKKTISPRNMTIAAVLGSIGLELVIQKKKRN